MRKQADETKGLLTQQFSWLKDSSFDFPPLQILLGARESRTIQVFIPPETAHPLWAPPQHRSLGLSRVPALVICAFLGKNQERLLITLDLTVMERMSFNLTSFTSYLIPSLFTVDFSLIHFNENGLFQIQSLAKFLFPSSRVPVFPGHFTNSLFPLLSSPTSYRLTGGVLKSILFIHIHLFSNILVALPKGQVVLFIGSRGCVCPMKTKSDACAGSFPSRYPTLLTSGCKKPRSSLEMESSKSDYLALLCSHVPRLCSRVTLHGFADGHSRFKMV